MSCNRINTRIPSARGPVQSTGDVIAAILTNRRSEPAQAHRRGLDPRDFLTIGHG